MKSGTLFKSIGEFFPDGTVPYDAALAEARGIPKGQSEPSVKRYPYWPPDLFAAMALLIERSGAYAYWDPSDSYLLSISEEAKWVGEIWRASYLEPDNDYRFNDARKFSEGEGDATLQLDEQEMAHYLLQSRWELLIEEFGDEPMSQVCSDGDVSEWCFAAIWLLIAADEASRGLGISRYASPTENGENLDDDEEAGWACAFFDQSLHGPQGSRFLSKASANTIWRQGGEIPKGVFETLTLRFDPSIANVLPKMRTPQLGATLRAFSHYLCHLPGSQEVITTWYQSPTAYRNNRVFNILAVPFPFEIPTRSFRPIDARTICKGRWGEFAIEQVWLEKFGDPEKQPAEFVKFLDELLSKARHEVVGDINAVVFPEASISPEIFEAIVDYLVSDSCSDVEVLIAGVAGDVQRFSTAGPENAYVSRADINVVAMAHFAPPVQADALQRDDDTEIGNGSFMDKRVASVFFQPKHHRWRIDRAQMDAYGLAARLGGVRYRWEHIATDLRHIQFLPVRTHGVLATLVCEDLARIDPCQSLLRSIGPNLLIALLMDGPQLNDRWPGRYATVLAEDPGSSVLSLTSAGLVKRNNQHSGFEPSHVVSLWRDAQSGVRPIELEPNSTGIVLSIDARSIEEWTMDDRSDGGNSTSFELVQITQVSHESVKYEP